MFLSKLLLNPTSRDAWRDLAAPYELHRTLKHAFARGEPEGNRLLFRIEPWHVGMPGVTVLVQTSSAPPDWSFLTSRTDAYCLRVDGPKPVRVAFEPGQPLAFRLVANPTKKQDGRRIALNAPDAYLAWLQRKAAAAGFEVSQADTVDFWINGEATGTSRAYAKHEIPLFGVRFDGLLRVTDPERLRAAVRGGIGPAKAFGFGLLSLAPAR